MSTTTSNLGLIKPERSDNYSVDVMGNNMDIIDSRITACENRITPLEERVVTVTPTNNKWHGLTAGFNLILHRIPGVKYTGSIKIIMDSTNSYTNYINVYNTFADTTPHESSVSWKEYGVKTITINFSDFESLWVDVSNSTWYVYGYTFTY